MVYRIKKGPQENLLLSLVYQVESPFEGREVLVESLFFRRNKNFTFIF